jgi:hypothetical protein
MFLCAITDMTPVPDGERSRIFVRVLAMFAASSPLQVLLCASVAMCAAPAAAQSYKCKDSSGAVSYQQAPCPGPSVEIPLSEADAKAHENAYEAKLPELANEVVFGAVFTESICRAAMPAFEQRIARQYATWRAVRPEQVRQAEALITTNAQMTAELAGLREKVANGLSKEEIAQLERQCGEEFIEQIERSSRPPDSRFSTPQRSFDLYVQALRSADRALAVSCLTGRYRSEMKKSFQELSDEGMRSMANFVKGLSGLRFERMADEASITKASGSVETSDGRRCCVDFQRVFGEWAIQFM